MKKGQEYNLVVIQVKTEKNNEDREIDRKKFEICLKNTATRSGY